MPTSDPSAWSSAALWCSRPNCTRMHLPQACHGSACKRGHTGAQCMHTIALQHARSVALCMTFACMAMAWEHEELKHSLQLHPCPSEAGPPHLEAGAASGNAGATPVGDLGGHGLVAAAVVGVDNVHPGLATDALRHVRQHLDRRRRGGCAIVVEVAPGAVPQVVYLSCHAVKLVRAFSRQGHFMRRAWRTEFWMRTMGRCKATACIMMRACSPQCQHWRS